MTTNFERQATISSIVCSFSYLDNYVSPGEDLNTIIKDLESRCSGDESYEQIKAAIAADPSLGEMVLLSQSGYTDGATSGVDMAVGCAFRCGDDVYVGYRGTGDGRWLDNGEGLAVVSTEMQQAAADYFDEVARTYGVSAHENGGSLIVTGHSKGGNLAQYVNMASECEYMIDNVYSFDGQGFSDLAIESFREKSGDEYYQKQLDRMYSICGENDYVHGLGYRIIPEENTFYLQYYGEGPFGTDMVHLHALGGLLGNGGSYGGLIWARDEEGNIINGEPGNLAEFVYVLSESVMKLPLEDREGACLAIMDIIQTVMAGGKDVETIGSLTVDLTDYVDLFAHGVPAILSALATKEGVELVSKEGAEIVLNLLKDEMKKRYEEDGLAGVLVLSAEIGLGILCLPAVIVAGEIFVDILKIVDAVYDFAVTICEGIANFVHTIKEMVHAMVKSIVEWYRNNLTSGGRYAQNNPYIMVDTGKLYDYADRLSSIHSRVCNLDSRMDRLYGQVGLLDLFRLLQADLLIGFNLRIASSEYYLRSTAKYFDDAEKTILSST